MIIISAIILLSMSLMPRVELYYNLDSFYNVQNKIALNSKINSYIDTYTVQCDPSEVVWDEAEIDPMTVYAAAAGGLSVRKLPSPAGSVVSTLKYGTAIRVVAVVNNYNGCSDTYYKVAGNANLYVSASLMLDHEPVNVQLDVANVLQHPELPDGCEVTSLSIVLRYAGVDTDKCELSDKYLPKSKTLDADPNEFYLREPRTNGFYCFAGPLVKCVNAYNEDKGTDIKTRDLTGCDVFELYKCIDKGIPVVVWGTLYWNDPWRYENGLYSNLHCMVLTGYTETSVSINDPIYGETVIDRARFERVFGLMESRAMIAYLE